jgi:hypothetical protein
MAADQDQYGNYTPLLYYNGYGIPVIPGTGGGGSAAPDSIDYPGPPVLTPPSLQNIVVDSNGEQFMYWAGAWH